MNKIEETIKTIHFSGREWDFHVRVCPGYDKAVTDEIVLREQFKENVYSVFPEDFRHTGVVVDIGANIGAFSVFAVANGAKKVYAFEPEKENFEMLCKNILENNLTDVIIPFNFGLFSYTGKLEMLSQQQAASHVRALKKIKTDVSGLPIKEVDVVTLEVALKEITECDVLKMDIEASEYEVFKTAELDSLQKIRKFVLEFHTASEEDFGRMMARLTEVFNIHLFGSYKRGGQLYATRY